VPYELNKFILLLFTVDSLGILCTSAEPYVVVVQQD